MYQKLAFSLIGLGILVLVGWGVGVFFMADTVPLAIRIAVAVVALGVLILIGVAIKDRLAKAKTESFKEVER